MYESIVYWVGDIPYSFEKNGEKMQGVTRRAMVVTLRDGQPYRADVCKCSNDFEMKPEDFCRPVTLLYNRFGKITGYTV